MTTLDDRDAAQRARSPARTILLLSVTILLGLRLWNGDGSSPGLRMRASFASRVRAHFDEWDLDRDGLLSMREVGSLVPDVRIRDEAAAALASIHAVQRMKDPRWSGTSFRREDLIGPRIGDLLGIDSPPLVAGYVVGLGHIRSAGRALFGDGAPALDGIHQGQSGDCFLIAHVAAVVARDPGAVRAMIDGAPDGGFTVRFPGGPPVRVPSISDVEIALGSTAGRQGIWLNVLEKAFGEIVLSRRRDEGPAVDALTRTGTPTGAIALLTGHEGYWFQFRTLGTPMGLPGARLDVLLPEARSVLRATDPPRWVTSCETTDTPTPPGMIPSHVYAVLGFDAGTDTVHLWNPLGNDFAPGGAAGIAAGYPVRDGHFSVPLADFLRIFVALTYESGRPGAG